jgi:hypothetical protein
MAREAGAARSVRQARLTILNGGRIVQHVAQQRRTWRWWVPVVTVAAAIMCPPPAVAQDSRSWVYVLEGRVVAVRMGPAPPPGVYGAHGVDYTPESDWCLTA